MSSQALVSETKKRRKKPVGVGKGKKKKKLHKSIYRVLLAVTIAKLFLVECYRSTDFEVHRNWLAITHSLPLEKWYSFEGSPWTLDYPPLFAWFERMLSAIGALIDPQMVDVNNINYHSFATVMFQRLTVILGDFVLWIAVVEYCRTWPKPSDTKNRSFLFESYSNRRTVAVVVITMTNAGLYLVDHIHFQYNGLLIGLFILSIVAIRRNQVLSSAIAHTVLLNMKHIFLFASPLYFVYMLSAYCLIESNSVYRSWEEFRISFRNRSFTFRWSRFLGLVLLTGMIFALSFGPFVALGQLPIVFHRMFPFGRGLTHAYWAPNLWAIYNAADVVLTRIVNPQMASMSTRGKIGQDFSTLTLPSVTPRHCGILTLLTMSPVLSKMWRRPHPKVFLEASLYILMCAFMCGYHVHEKAILMVTIPLGCAAMNSLTGANLCFVLNVAANCSLLPLLPEIQETPIKLLLVAFHTVVNYEVLDNEIRFNQKANHMRETGLLLPRWLSLYLLGFVPVIAFYSVIQPLCFPHYEYLPLMLFSVYSAAGFVFCWRQCYLLFFETHNKIFGRRI